MRVGRSVPLVATWILCLAPLQACRCQDAGQEVLTVGAAMSLRDALTAVGLRFEAGHPDLRVRFHFASSGTVATQIINGAPLDVFASASRRHMDRVIAAGEARREDAREFAANRLVLIQSGQIDRRMGGLSELGEAGRVAMGDPESVPAGRYARACLEHQGLWTRVRPRLVYAAHVRQVLDWVARGEVDAGLVYLTDARNRAGDVAIVGQVPAACHPPIVYPVSVLSGASAPERAGQFVDFLCGPEGRALLSAHGFSAPGAAP